MNDAPLMNDAPQSALHRRARLHCAFHHPLFAIVSPVYSLSRHFFYRERTMKKIIVVAASALFMTGAFAQASAPVATGTAPNAPVKRSMTNAGVEAHIKDLHNKLKITSAEEDQWNKVAQVMRDNAAQMTDLMSKREANEYTMTAVDDLNSYGEIAQAHADGVKKMSAVFEPLYSSMPDAQKKTADAVFHPRQHTAKGKTN
jgi:protein CpxP